MDCRVGIGWMIAACALGSIAEGNGPGFSVEVCPASETYPRNTEASLIALKDGRLLLAYSRFYGGIGDASAAHIAGKTSADGGRTWSRDVVLQENEGQQNVMSVSLIRMTSGRLGMFYLRTNGDHDLKVYLKTSGNEGGSWSKAICVTPEAGYHVMNNDRVIRLRSGRLLAPLAYTGDSRKTNHYRSVCFLSDDDGKTWRRGRGDVDAGKRGAMEPGVVERKDGRVLMNIRTQFGQIYSATSKDGGDTWSKAEEMGVAAPEAPSQLVRIPSTGDLMLIWNDSVDPDHHHFGERCPLNIAVSKDEGKTWSATQVLEADCGFSYSYPSTVFVGDDVLLTYYVHDEAKKRLSLRFRRFPVDWLYR